MPRLAHAVPKYRKHRASGQAIVTLAGKDHYLGPHGTKASKLLYDRLISEYLAANRQPQLLTADEQRITVVQVLVRPKRGKSSDKLVIGDWSILGNIRDGLQEKCFGSY